MTAKLVKARGWIIGAFALVWPIVTFAPFNFYLVVFFWIASVARAILGSCEHKNPFYRVAWRVCLIGFLCNSSVVLANHGKMPVTLQHSIREISRDDTRHTLATQDSRLMPLSDKYWSGIGICSVGDGIILLGGLVSIPGMIVRKKYRADEGPTA